MNQHPNAASANLPYRRGGRTVLSLAVSSLLTLTPLVVAAEKSERVSVQTDSTLAAYAKPVTAKYPFNKCKDAITGMSGLCVLVSKAPKVNTNFYLRSTKSKGASSVQSVQANTFVRLEPGDYLLYTEGDLDQLHERQITISSGALSVVQTATFKFNSKGKHYYRIQHYQNENGINNRGCSATVIRRGARAVLPGSYQVNLVKDKSQGQAQCLNGGTTINAMAGQGLSVSSRTVIKQTIPDTNHFRHPNGVSALTSISQFGAGIWQLSLLPQWRSFNGIHNPFSSPVDALVLSGIGTQEFMIPFDYQPKKRECGISLAQGGLHAHVLLTNCKFRGATLTGFRVNSGNYYMLNNRHGKTAIEGNFINNPINVSDVAFRF